MEKLAEHGVQEVQVYSKEMVLISSLAPAAKLQFRQGNKEELICKHLSGSKEVGRVFTASKWTTGPQNTTSRLRKVDFSPLKQSEASQPGLHPSPPRSTCCDLSDTEHAHARCRAVCVHARVWDWGNTVGALWRHETSAGTGSTDEAEPVRR